MAFAFGSLEAQGFGLLHALPRILGALSRLPDEDDQHGAKQHGEESGGSKGSHFQRDGDICEGEEDAVHSRSLHDSDHCSPIVHGSPRLGRHAEGWAGVDQTRGNTIFSGISL